MCTANCKCSIACVNKADGSNESMDDDDDDENGKLDQAEGGEEEADENTPKKSK